MNHSHKLLTDILRWMLTPVIRFCLRRSLKVRDVIEMTKVLFIDVARREMKASAQEVNVSRLSVVTGLHRRDVMRIFEEENVKEEPQSLVMRITGQWQYDKRFNRSAGKPRPLTYEGVESEFKSLVRSVSKDLKAVTVLFELERLGMIEKNGDKVMLTQPGYKTTGDFSNTFRVVGKDLDDLFEAAEENALNANEIPNLHIRTTYDKVVASAEPEVREWLLSEGSKFHERAREYLSKFDADINSQLAREKKFVKVALGSYSFLGHRSKKD